MGLGVCEMNGSLVVQGWGPSWAQAFLVGYVSEVPWPGGAGQHQVAGWPGAPGQGLGGGRIWDGSEAAGPEARVGGSPAPLRQALVVSGMSDRVITGSSEDGGGAGR